MNRLIFSVMLSIAGVAVSSATWADISESTFTPQGSDIYPSVPVSQVEVFVYKPDFNFKIIGAIEARGMFEGDLLDQLNIFANSSSEKKDIALALKALKSEAADAGATGVIIIQSRQVRVSEDGTERRIKAVAIRRTP